MKVPTDKDNVPARRALPASTLPVVAGAQAQVDGSLAFRSQREESGPVLEAPALWSVLTFGLRAEGQSRFGPVTAMAVRAMRWVRPQRPPSAWCRVRRRRGG